VFGTTRTASKLDAARQYGLSDGAVLAEGPSSLSGAVQQWTNNRGVDVVLDLVGGDYAGASLDILAHRGRLMLIGAVGGGRAQFNVLRAITHRLRIQGSVLRSRKLDERVATVASFARDVSPLLEQQIVRPVVDSVFTLDAIADAHRRLESNTTFGKVVITCH
jgi:NADPH:quinone reductase-like Zn-dependent oxidoreductase